MKRALLYSFLSLLSILLFQNAGAQCSNFVDNYPNGIYTTSDLNWHTVTNCAYGGEFQRFIVVEGATYQFRTCQGTFFNSEITLWDAPHSNVLGYETNNCGNNGRITWIASFSGEVNLLVTRNGCQAINSCARVQWRMRNLPPPPVNDSPCNATLVDVGTSCEFQEVIQVGATSSGIPAPVCGAYSGNDVWYQSVVPPSGAMVFSTQEGTITDAAMAIYSGTCNALTELACSDDVNVRMPEIQYTGLVPGSIVFIRLFSYGNFEQGTVGLCVFELCTSAPVNDLPCDAEVLIFGSPTTRRNDCSSDASESWVPSCWTGGAVNSVWFSFDAPNGGSVSVNTTPQGTWATQVAIFSGDCSGLNEIDCNQNTGEGCGSDGSSSLIVNGLTPGDTYYIMVDGQLDMTGYFDITVTNLVNVSPQSGSDCGSPILLCDDQISFADPGPQGTGTFCDFDGSDNCTGGERNSIWYQIEVGANGDLNFIITPNDASFNSCITETDYDFVLWKIQGQGQTTDCANILSNTSRGLRACNYSDMGVTGVMPGGDSPAPYASCFDTAFEPSVSVKNGDILLLVIQNYQGSTTGFSLDLSDSDPGVINTGNPSIVYWSGGVDDTWGQSTNWGNCGVIPLCNVSAVVPASATSFPNIQGAHSVHDLTIESGASLIMGPGSELHVCGDFINYGSLVIDPSATILFDNANQAQTLSGNLTGSNSIGNLVIDKSGRQVTLFSSLEIKGDFSTSSATSVIRIRQNEIFLGGDFNNAVGNSTFKGTGPLSKLIFNGTGTQHYSQGSVKLDLGRVVIDKPGGRLELITDLRVKDGFGSIELINGVIETGNRRVYIRNPDASALNQGNPNSYIEGILQRFVAQTGLFHFPVGHAATGYQRADVTFRSHGFNSIVARHSPWVSLAGPLNQMDCNAGLNLDALDNGFFTLTANTNPTVADYDISLHNYNYSNSAGAQGWTVMKDSGSGWMLDGNCVSPTNPDVVQRTDLSGFSRFGTAQASTPLPIELLSFTGKAEQVGNLLEWITASEIDNEGFLLESSEDAITFTAIGEIAGAGNSNVEVNYSFLDRNVISGTTYYRLKQMDYSGVVDYSNIIAIERGEDDSNIVAYPNPMEDFIDIRIPEEDYDVVDMRITDLVGRVLIKKLLQSDFHLKSTMRIDVSELKSGHYTLTAHDSSADIIYRQGLVKH